MEETKAELTSFLSHEIVREIAPDEMDLFDDFKEEFFKNPDGFMEKKFKKNEEKMLGFGGTGVEQFIIPVVLPIVWGFLTYVGKIGFEAAIQKTGEEIIVKILEKDKPLTKEKIKEMREYGISLARNQKLDEEKAMVIVDALIGKFVQM